MRRFAALTVALGMASVVAQAAIVQYSLTGVTENGSVISGSFSYDTATIGVNYSEPNAAGDLLSFTVSFTSIPSAPTSTSFSLSDPSDFFYVQTDGLGNLTTFTPGFFTNEAPLSYNGNGYRLVPIAENQSMLIHQTSEPFPVDTVVAWQYTQVPELSHTALGAGLGLLGFVGLRAWRNRR